MFTNVRVFPVKEGGKVLARGDFLFADKLKVSFTLFKGDSGPFVGLPGHYSKPDDAGQKKWFNDVFLADKTLVKQMNEVVVAKYNEGKGNNQVAESSDDLPF